MSQFGNTLQDRVAITLSKKSYTRAQLGAKLGVSRTVLSRALDPLIQDRFVEYTIVERRATTGRPVQSLSLCKKSAYIVGLSIARRSATGIIVNRAGTQIARAKLDYLDYQGWEYPLRLILQELRKLIAAENLMAESIVGTGVALPMSGFQQTDVGKLKEIIADSFSGACFFDNIVSMAALAQSGSENLTTVAQPKMYVRLSGGVGSCLMWESPLGNIPQVIAGEFGHVSVPGWDDLACHCGNAGCLEMLASAVALCRNAQAVDLTQFAQRIAAKDAVAEKVFADAVQALGFACAQAAMTLHPSSINFGGEVVESLPQIVPLTTKVMREYFSPAIHWKVPINGIVMDEDNCAFGAVYAVKAGITTSQIKNGSITTGVAL